MIRYYVTGRYRGVDTAQNYPEIISAGALFLNFVQILGARTKIVGRMAESDKIDIITTFSTVLKVLVVRNEH